MYTKDLDGRLAILDFSDDKQATIPLVANFSSFRSRSVSFRKRKAQALPTRSVCPSKEEAIALDAHTCRRHGQT